MQIEIDMRDVYRSLGAGRRIVTYLGFRKGRLHCEDLLGNRLRVPQKLFRFRSIVGYETRLADNGHVEINVDGKWQSLGPLFSNNRRRMAKKKETK